MARRQRRVLTRSACKNKEGPTKTIALTTNGTAVNAGNNANIPGGVTTDQRGQSRIQGGTVDIGAFESAYLAVATNVEHYIAYEQQHVDSLSPAPADGHRR